MASSVIATFNSSSSPTPHPNLRPHPSPTHRFHITPFPFPVMGSFPGTKMAPLVVKCSSSDKNSSETGNSNLRDMLSGIVDERVELLLSKEENRVLLEGLEEAAQRVERAKRELAEFDRQQAEAQMLRDYVNKLQSTTSEIAECQKEISEAKGMVEEAYRSLEANGVGVEDSLDEMKTESINKDEERLESVTAASVSAVVGTLAGLPVYLTRATGFNDLILPLAITFVSCALFGVTYRYAVRRDLDNVQLKSGTSAAFGIVKGLATLGAKPNLQLDIGSLYPIALDSAVYISENLLIFLFAGVALDFFRVVSIFPQTRLVHAKSFPKTMQYVFFLLSRKRKPAIEIQFHIMMNASGMGSARSSGHSISSCSLE